jgi:Tol biopolymer transport system component
VGAALHKVHARGLVHGALSPHAIVLGSRGAYILQPSASFADRAPYRAPEQIRGEEPDVRSDVFAYGALLYEIACGQRAFPGAGAELNQRILNQEPPPAGSVVSQAMEDVIAGCLEKDPSQRRQRVQNAVIELKLAGRSVSRGGTSSRRMPRNPAPAPGPAAMSGPAPRRPEPLTVTAAARVAPYAAQGAEMMRDPRFGRRQWVIGGALLALAAASLAAVLFLQRKPAPPVLKFAVNQPENTSFPSMPAVSPDGRYLTFSAVGPEGKRMLWLRPLDALHATVILGSEGASAPFWSPDSQSIAFFGGKYLKKVRISGGAPEDICQAEASPGGGAWSREGVVLFAPSLSDGLYRVPASGGKPQPVLKLDDAKSERADLWPQFLPDDKHFVFYQQTDLAETSGVYLGSIDQPGYRRLFTSQTNAVYSAAAPDTPKVGYLLYINERNLMALGFNAGRLEAGDAPITLANDIGAVRSLALAPSSVSTTGVLVFQGVGLPTRQMVWMDRGGRQLAVSGTPGVWGPPRISPDGERAVVAKVGPDGRSANLWLLDSGGPAEQMTDGPVHVGSPVWSPDGRRIAHFARQGNAYDIFVRPAQVGSKAEVLLKGTDQKFPTDWSHDGKYILFSVEGAGTRWDLWGLSMADHRAAPILDTIYEENYATISPDGRWLAYQSSQSGRDEVYLQPFDGLGRGTRRRWTVSKGGGLPRWRADSAELFYMTIDGHAVSVPVRQGNGGGVEFGTPQVLFQSRPLPNSWNLWDVAPDGQRFLINAPLEWTSAAPITVITNWTEKLKI